MCLSRVTETNLNCHGIGYKAVRWVSGQYKTSDREMEISRTSKELVDTNDYGIWISPRRKYPTGFHILRTLKDAKVYAGGYLTVIKVKYRKGHTRGVQRVNKGLCKVVVAKCMTFVGVAWKPGGQQ